MKIRRRKSNRVKPVAETAIAVYLQGERIEGTVLDVTDEGLGTLFPANSQFEVGRTVHAFYRRERLRAKMVRVSPTDEGVQVGLRFV